MIQSVDHLRELFGTHPTGINFELYDDIPVESSHMDHSPIDQVTIFVSRNMRTVKRFLFFVYLYSLMTVILVKLSKIILTWRITVNQRLYNDTLCLQFYFDVT